MLRHCWWVILLCGLPVVSFAAEVDNASCQTAQASEEAFEPVAGQALTRAQADALQRLFRDLGGDWQGHAVEQVCMVSGSTRTHAYSVQLRLDGSTKQLLITGQYQQDNNGASRRFTRKLLLTSDGLRVDHAGGVGDVALRRADRSGLGYAQRYRTVQALPEDPNAAATSAPSDPVVSVLSAASQVFLDDGTTSGDTDSSSNLVTGEVATTQPAAQPRRRSLVREERFTLQTSGSRQLTLTQDFYTQGAFTGSMHWQLQRR